MDNNIYHEVEEKNKNDKINIEPINNSNIQNNNNNNNNNNPFIQNNTTNEDKTTPIDQLPTVEPDMKEQLKKFFKICFQNNITKHIKEMLTKLL